MERKPSIWKWTVRLLIAGVVFFGVVVIFNVTVTGSFIYKLDKRAEEYANQPPPDPACFVSDKLRVRIGEEYFSFPNDSLLSVTGSDVRNVKSFQSKTAGKSDLCQYPDDLPWSIDHITLKLYPKHCPANKLHCDETLIHATVSDLNYRRQNNLPDNIFPETKKELLQNCKAPLKALSDWHATYWTACDYVFRAEGLHIRIKFRGGAYPPEEIEKTKALILDVIQSHRLE